MIVQSSSKSTVAVVLDTLQKRNLLKQAEARFLQEKYHSATELANVLLGKKVVTQDELAKIFAVALNLPFVRLQGMRIATKVLERLPYDLALRRLVIAYEENPTTLKLAIAEPYRLMPTGGGGPLHELSKTIGKNIEISVTTRADVMELLDQYAKPSQASAPLEETIDLEKMSIDQTVLRKFPYEVAKKYKMIVFESPSEKEIKVAAVAPEDPKMQELLSFLKQRNGINITLFRASEAGVEHALAEYGAKAAATTESIQPIEKLEDRASDKLTAARSTSIAAPESSVEFEETNIDKLIGKIVSSQEQLAAEVRSGFVPRVVGAIMSYAAALRASDVHLEPAKTFYRLRYRIDGQLQEVLRMPLALHAPVVSRIKILSRMKIDEKRIPQDGRMDIIAGGHDIDIRVASFPTIFGEKLLLRLLDKSQSMLTLEKIGMEGRNLEIVNREIAKPWGMILSTGPTGSGKSTTLYAILQKLSTVRVNIVTLEDPIEYEIPGINQSQVKPKIGYSFAEGLRSILRQDPNIIMVGEIRDHETAELSTQAALTGHLVFSTLHTNDAASTVTRLVNVGVEPFLITSALNCVIGQRLVRKLCEHCRKKATLPPAFLENVTKTMTGMAGYNPSSEFYAPVGCNQCTGGYRGRIGIFEVMPISEKIEHSTVARQPASEIEKIAISEGMISMRQDGVLKAARGITSLDEVWKATTND